MEASKDIWHAWLLKRRFGGDEKRAQEMLLQLYPVRDRILTNAQLSDGKVLLDVGCGDGLIAFGALEKNKTCRVIFSDISQDLLDHCRAVTEQTQVMDRCEFLRASADDLSARTDSSVDVVTTRSVLIYVKEKQRAFNEFYRVLKPNGRVSIYEPINAYPGLPPLTAPENYLGYDTRAIVDLTRKMNAVYARFQVPRDDPMLDFDERDLLSCATKAGLSEIHLELQVNVRPKMQAIAWESFIKSSGNPKIPTLEEAMNEALTQEEREKFVAHMRPRVENKEGVDRGAVAFLWGVKR
ncbi:MAG: class I SAM-dependent methyltransferase [Chloroflexi bacterium]|nr:class I SAM-dependent methyltransferase [Chloroflexota bacterium]